jgi:indolepyruvate ferredoxin oxidoreductase beta subunit
MCEVICIAFAVLMHTLRYQIEDQRILDWLMRIKAMASAPAGYAASVELAECQRLVKGYSDTHERGLKNYQAVLTAVERMTGRPGLADTIRQLRMAALADDQGTRLQAMLIELERSSAAAA